MEKEYPPFYRWKSWRKDFKVILKNSPTTLCSRGKNSISFKLLSLVLPNALKFAENKKIYRCAAPQDSTIITFLQISRDAVPW